MGKGKGSIEFYVARVKPGRIMFECEGVDEETARAAFALGAAKLPIKTKFVKKLNSEQGVGAGVTVGMNPFNLSNT